jgi:hypothetical protein
MLYADHPVELRIQESALKGGEVLQHLEMPVCHT